MEPEGSLLDSSKIGSECTMYHCDTFLLTTVTVEKQHCMFVCCLAVYKYYVLGNNSFMANECHWKNKVYARLQLQCLMLYHKKMFVCPWPSLDIQFG